MRRYTGFPTYTTDNYGRQGQYVYAELAVSFSPVRFAVRVNGSNAFSIHPLTSRRFNYQARDSPQDLLGRAKWRIDWFGRFSGPAYLQCPRITGAPRELRATLIRSRDPAFSVIEFNLDGASYQLSRRPPRGVNAWARERFPPTDATHDSWEESPPGDPSSGSHDLPHGENERPPALGVAITSRRGYSGES